jgi:hypothetical protein
MNLHRVPRKLIFLRAAGEIESNSILQNLTLREEYDPFLVIVHGHLPFNHMLAIVAI